ncbi:hypothetical protein A3B18_02075 [Candidatus Giovannonibacteria bacterium RIFCSPLOWO2_01_FULL_46_13]|uniref:Nudix hydrolase domain-containing protein n=1 Tax=Candidatus Giovannonibacteria bacterium RIFCSPLOWO2_01_FULL_46_13 TaxID=1798352 RepID=A0A1F5X674_9BACT|nr:MAG: hypothetical protein A3B18_02075 [Candidatus Giovannonibacteria bacterium RIFCSPLOWO2_01_FULL_46_13]
MAHIHELIDFVAEAYIVHDNNILLILHKKLKIWLPIGGHIELNEDPDQALMREIEEESGLNVEIIADRLEREDANFKHLYQPGYLNITMGPDHRHVNLVYFARAKSDKFVFNKEEHDDIRWFKEDELADPRYEILPVVQFYAKEARKRAG